MHVDVVDQLLPCLLQPADLAKHLLLRLSALRLFFRLRLAFAGGEQGQHLGEGGGLGRRRPGTSLTGRRQLTEAEIYEFESWSKVGSNR